MAIDLINPSAENLERSVVMPSVVFHAFFLATIAIGSETGQKEPGGNADKRSAGVVKVSKTTDRITCVAFSADGQLLAIASDEGGLWLHETRTGRLLRTLREDPPTPKSDLAPGGVEPVEKADNGMHWPVTALAFDQVGNRVAAATHTGLDIHAQGGGHLIVLPTRMDIEIYSVTDGKKAGLIRGPAEEDVQALAFEPDGKRICTIDSYRQFSVWGIGEGLRLSSFGSRPRPAQVRSPNWVESAFNRDSNRAASVMVEVEADVDVPVELTLWDRDTRSQRVMKSIALPGIRSLDYVAVSQDGRLVAVNADDKAVHLVNFERASLIRSIPIGDGFIQAFLVFRPDGGQILAINSEGFVRVSNVAGGEFSEISHGEPGVVRAVHWDGGRVLVVSGGVSMLHPDKGDRNSPAQLEALSIWSVEIRRP